MTLRIRRLPIRRGVTKFTFVQVWPRSILVDAGPLIALGKVRDAEHRRALQFATVFRGILITTLPVIAEACHFLSDTKTSLFGQIRDGAIVIEEIGVQDMTRLVQICTKYPQADFADASLIVIAERTGIMQIAMIDDTDFSIYRTRSGKHFTNLF